MFTAFACLLATTGSARDPLLDAPVHGVSEAVAFAAKLQQNKQAAQATLEAKRKAKVGRGMMSGCGGRVWSRYVVGWEEETESGWL